MAQSADADGSFLDPPYKNLQRVNTRANLRRSAVLRPFDVITERLPSKSNTLDLIASMTPVRSQAARGTCSIFSATALLEGLMVRNNLAAATELDLSEEWLEYVKAAESGGEGSTSPANISYFRRLGSVKESSWNYVGETWDTVDFSDLAQERCGKLEGFNQKKCLIGHRAPGLLRASEFQLQNANGNFFDPDFLEIRIESQAFKRKLGQLPSYQYLNSEDEVKAKLASGVPVLLDIDFYFGAWNHRKGPELGIERNLQHWMEGIIGYPEMGSVDRRASKEDPAGHSVLLVGYDDNEIVTINSKMDDGTVKTFTYRGVYIFKNSWGTGSFGTQTTIEGQVVPGYGKITQKYAHDFGGFYAWSLEQQN